MPQRTLKPCAKPGCKELVRIGARCAAHAEARPSSAERGYDGQWRRLRQQHLEQHPRCKSCNEPGTNVDHVVPHRGDDRLRLDPGNLQTLCQSCHSRKTATHDHGFGNKG